MKFNSKFIYVYQEMVTPCIIKKMLTPCIIKKKIKKNKHGKVAKIDTFFEKFPILDANRVSYIVKFMNEQQSISKAN